MSKKKKKEEVKEKMLFSDLKQDENIKEEKEKPISTNFSDFDQRNWGWDEPFY